MKNIINEVKREIKMRKAQKQLKAEIGKIISKHYKEYGAVSLAELDREVNK